METRTSRSQRSSRFMLIFLLFQSFWMSAQQNTLSKKLGISGDEMNSVYIIGGVLVFGIGVYVIYSIIERNRKEETPTNRRSVSHRHHHHHRVVKKSA